MSKLKKAELDRIVTEAIQKAYPGATEITVSQLGSFVVEGTMAYAAFTRDSKRDFSYALVEPDLECRLFDDGEALVHFFQSLVDSKRTLWQRFNELDFNDVIGAFIAFVIIGGFAVLVVHAGWAGNLGGDTISKEFLAIVSVVLGFYFGRSRRPN